MTTRLESGDDDGARRRDGLRTANGYEERFGRFCVACLVPRGSEESAGQFCCGGSPEVCAQVVSCTSAPRAGRPGPGRGVRPLSPNNNNKHGQRGAASLA
ncbi:hypothetical protein AOLI_G00079220 [Acnodon oligacanthus]